MKWQEPIPATAGHVVHASAPLEQLSLTNDRSDYLYYTTTLSAADFNDVDVGAAIRRTSVSRNRPIATRFASADEATTIRTVNLTIATIEASAMLVFFDGVLVGAADDHTKGPNHLTLTIPVPLPRVLMQGLGVATNANKSTSGSSPRTSNGVVNGSDAKLGGTRDVIEVVVLSSALGIQNFHGTNPKLFVKGILGDIALAGANITAPSNGWYHRPKLTGELLFAPFPNSTVAWKPMSSTPAAAAESDTRASAFVAAAVSRGVSTAAAGAGVCANTSATPTSWYKRLFADPRGQAGMRDNRTVLLFDAIEFTRGHFYVNGHDLGRCVTRLS
jgi:hypothetical protein